MSTNPSRLADLKEVFYARRRLAIYLMSGTVSVGLDYITFLILYLALGQDVAIAAPIGLMVGLTASFTLNKLLTFSDQAAKGIKQTGVQIFFYMMLFIANNIFTIYFIKLLIVVGVSAAIGKLAATVIITFWNYILYKAIIFK